MMSGSAFPSTITMVLSPNNGSGDNFGFIEQGNGFVITIHGGVPFDFFQAFGYTPGSQLGGTVPVFFSSGTAQFGNTTYDLSFNGPGSLFMSSFALPTNGQGFAVSVQLIFSALATIPDTGQNLSISGSGNGTINFSFDPSSGLYFPSNLVVTTTTVPESETLAFMGTGLMGLIGLLRRKIRSGG